MKVLKCSECWLPREKGNSFCKKCTNTKQSDAFITALKDILLNKPLQLSSLQETLSSKDLAFVLLHALTKSHPLANEIKNASVWPDVVKEIRFHTKPNSMTCSAFRTLMDKGLYQEIAIPEECCECMYTAVTRGYSSYCNLAIGHLFYSDKEKLIQLFKRYLQSNGGRNSLLNYINFMLWISNSTEFMTPVASRRVIDVLLEAVPIHSPNKQWILEELVLRPENYQFFLSSPPLLPGNFTETMFDYFQDFEVWWNFWQRVNATARKKIEFRNHAIKDELMMVTWDVERVRDWCLDTEELTHVNRFFGRRTGRAHDA
jgi:hypothetical protein